ncbi:hypothetical protein [Saccharopolyspora rosea]|uniref:Uncharacterized protein n=1 Tax=Saccharopolyspora rosea TaxID=524884 RepID=A0ABW3FT45_9PSEU|nr:hypothetical protein [Saccharopolyspora rosea]
MAVPENDQLCHELLLRLAGRLPDRFLWRYRDWLAGGAADVLARSLPATLLRERIPLDDADHRLLAEALLPLGADRSVVDAIPPADRPAADHAFSPGSATDGRTDSELLVLGATLRGRPGVGEVRSSWRRDDGGRAKRVVLVTASADVIALTGEIQRVLRALGDAEPCVEVIPSELDPTPYHRAALAESVLVCTGADELVGHRGFSGANP